MIKKPIDEVFAYASDWVKWSDGLKVFLIVKQPMK
jgi:hypothetical protein